MTLGGITMIKNKLFVSDNTSGVDERIMKSLEMANRGQVLGYGEDEYTKKAIQMFKERLGQDIDVYFVFNGTGANVAVLKELSRSYNSIISSSVGHINVDECGAPESVVGCKIIGVEHKNGKIDVDDIQRELSVKGSHHHSQPKAIYISQSTEFGSVYSIEEIKRISEFAHRNDMYVFVDGARIANAIASLGCTMREILVDTNIDAAVFGGTKNGMMFGEAVIFFNKELSKDFKYIRKNLLQLSSKMRFISAQFIAYLENDAWLENAKNANKMARVLAERCQSLNGFELEREVEANEIFLTVDSDYLKYMTEYVWDAEKSQVRFVTSFNTSKEDIDGFVLELESIVKQPMKI